MFKPCLKRGFVYEKDANAFLGKLKHVYKQGKKVPVRSYLCDCGLWHLTSREHPLEDEIVRLTDENTRMKAELEKLKGQERLSTAEKKELKKEKRVQQLMQENAKLQSRVRALDRTVQDLIVKNIALGNGRQTG